MRKEGRKGGGGSKGGRRGEGVSGGRSEGGGRGEGVRGGRKGEVRGGGRK